jgi:hypothetical protein
LPGLASHLHLLCGWGYRYEPQPRCCLTVFEGGEFENDSAGGLVLNGHIQIDVHGPAGLKDLLPKGLVYSEARLMLVVGQG